MNKNTTPEQLLKQYTTQRNISGYDYDYIFDNIKTVIMSCKYANGRTTIITKIIKKLGDENNNIIYTEQKS